MPFSEYEAVIAKVVEDKFRLASGARIEIHVASNAGDGRGSDHPADGGPAASGRTSPMEG